MSESDAGTADPITNPPRRGPKPQPPPPALTSWEPGIPVGPDERRSLADAALDAAYRWAATLAEGRDALDLGCGAGHGAALLARSGAGSVLAVESDPAALEAARERYGEQIDLAPRVPAEAGFDLVTCFGGLRGAVDPLALARELKPVLAPGGIAVFAAPLAPPTDPIEGGAESAPPAPDELERSLAGQFEHLHARRLRVVTGAAVLDSADDEPPGALEWLGDAHGEDHAILVAASDAPLPPPQNVAVLTDASDLRAYDDALAAWEHRARLAEAEGSAKHWELVASREAQRRLRKRLHHLEHRPLRMLGRLLRGKRPRLGSGPPIRLSEKPPERWEG